MQTDELQRRDHSYASFSSRVVATLLDYAFLALLLFLLRYLFDIHISFVFELLLFFLYSTFMLTTKLQGTLGKWLTGLYVCNQDGRTLSYKEALMRSGFALISYTLILPLFVLFFTKKRQTFHDLMAQTFVIDKTQKYTLFSKKTPNLVKTNKFTKLLVTGLVTALVLFVLINAGPVFVVYSMLYYNHYQSYKESFFQQHTVDTYNDPKILFYKSELEKNVAPFIEASDLYTRFQYDTKIEIAEECLAHHYKEHTKSYGVSRNIYTNARNSYANTEEKRDKAKENEHKMGQHFYTYDSNLVHHTIENFLKPTQENSPCDSLVDVDTLYSKFLSLYIYDYLVNNIQHPYSQPQQREIDWYNTLITLMPQLLDAIQEKKQQLALQKQQRASQKQAQKERYEQSIRDDVAKHLKELATNTQKRHLPLFKLHEFGADLDVRIEDGRTALILAALHKNAHFVSNLLFYDVDTDTKDRFNKTAIDYIDKKEAPHIYGMLKIHDALKKAPEFKEKVYHESASYDYKTDTVTVRKSGQDSTTWSPLVLAIKDKDQKMVRHYIEQKQYLDHTTNNGSPPLFASILFNNKLAFKFLLDSGADIDQQNNSGQTALHAALFQKDTYFIAMLLKNGANFYLRDSSEQSAFTQALLSNDISIVKLFLKHNADVNYQYKRDETPLTLVAKGCQNYEMTRFLLKSGADPDLRDKYGFSTRDGLSRYCRDKVAYKKFITLINSYE
jgi:ankyrin repeat protein/uncharacterized RDD family membrane protein YckC